MIKYGINNYNDNYYEKFLFNSSDLMSEIFQYLEWGMYFSGDLFSCNLVCSHWLYHVWNPNSVYYFNFCSLFEGRERWPRIWQRLYNVKSIRINFSPKHSKAIPAMNKLCIAMLKKKVEKVYIVASRDRVDRCISAVIPLMSRCKDRIKHCGIQIIPDDSDSSNFKAPSPLRLAKAECVEIGDLFFYRIWTNECTQLELYRVKNVNKDWCKFVIENCDCSNINSLTLDSVRFGNNSINQVILKQFALKFYNLKTLKMVIEYPVDDNVLLFLQLLKPIISKNKTNVGVKVRYFKHDKAIFLSKRMNDKDLKIDKLIIGDTYKHSEIIDDTIKLIQERDDRGLNHLAIYTSMYERQMKSLVHKLKCKSITIFELKNSNIRAINPLLESKIIEEKQIFVIIDVYGYYVQFDDKHLSLFKKFYQNISQLFVKQIAFDIKIEFKKVKDSKAFDSHLSLYSSYFENSQFLSKYNSPNCNSNLCLPRDKPYTYFYIHDSNQYDGRWFVFGATNVQMK